MGGGKNAKNVIKYVLQAARSAVKKAGGKKCIKTLRILKLPAKTGVILPFLIPLFAGLSATDAIANSGFNIIL